MGRLGQGEWTQGQGTSNFLAIFSVPHAHTRQGYGGECTACYLRSASSLAGDSHEGSETLKSPDEAPDDLFLE